MSLKQYRFKDKRAIIFDFDGTIADTFQIHDQAFQHALKDYALDFLYKDYAGMSTKEAFQLIFVKNKYSITPEELGLLVNRKRQIANQLYQQSIKFIANAKEFIELLHEHGFRLYVGSSGSRMNVIAGLKVLGIDQYFADVVTANEVEKSKPDPEIFQKILDRHSIQPREALVIEDALSGIEAARAAGIDVICVDTEMDCDEQYKNCVLFTNFSNLIQQFKTEFQDA